MRKQQILIVEDDVDVRLGYEILLQAHGYGTVVAADSSAAIRRAIEHQPDLVILDLGLPSGDGLEVLERFGATADLSEVPVIVVSGRDVLANRDRALKAGARAFLLKPWNDTEILDLIAQLLDRPASAAS